MDYSYDICHLVIHNNTGNNNATRKELSKSFGESKIIVLMLFFHFIN